MAEDIEVSEISEDSDEPEIGSRVHVYSVDEEHDLGYGTYLGTVSLEEALEDEGPAAVQVPDILDFSPKEIEEATAIVDRMLESGEGTPMIRLDSGEIVYGFQCWWHRVFEFETIQ